MNQKYTLKDKSQSLRSEQIRLMQESDASVWKGYVFIINEKWKINKMNEACNKIQEWDLQEMLWLDHNKAQNIIKQIQNIKFPKLLRLSINGNNIQSIENLCRIDFPSLKYIYFQHNAIKSIKTLTKCKFDKLLAIGITGNPLTDCDQFYLHKFASIMDQISLQLGNSREVCSHLNWLPKLQAVTIQRIYIRSIGRIKQQNILKVLEKQRNMLCIQT